MPTAQNSNSQNSTKIKTNKSESSKLINSNLTSNQISDENNFAEQLNNNTDKNIGGIKTPQEQPEFIKQALIIIEKKVRNLEKRRIKLEEYKSIQKNGEKLNEDQLSAVSKFDEVIRTLELTRELEKQFVALANDAIKQQKKQVKKEQLEKDEAIKEKLKDAYKYISLINKFKSDSIRSDFLNETNGACKIDENEMSLIENFQNLIQPCEPGVTLDIAASEVADHLISLVESKTKPIIQLNNITYIELKKLLDKVLTSEYWLYNKENREHNTTNKISDEQEDKPKETLLEIKIDKPIDDNCRQLEQFHQQNTSEDYVLVTTNNQALPISEFNENNPNLVTSNQIHSQAKTFFSTLNPAELSTQFLDRLENANEESLNFLQDSEIQDQTYTYDTYNSNNSENLKINYQDLNQNVQTKELNYRHSYKANHREYSNRNYPRPRNTDDKRNNILNQRTNNSSGNFVNVRNPNGNAYRSNNLSTSSENRPGNNYKSNSSNTNRSGVPRTGNRNQHDNQSQVINQN